MPLQKGDVIANNMNVENILLIPKKKKEKYLEYQEKYI